MPFGLCFSFSPAFICVCAISSEDENLKSQNVTSSWGGIRKLPYAFTENGIAMLSSVLRSPMAIATNIHIMRAFDDNTKREVYERQGGICPICKKHFDIEQMEADHITPWVEGGRTVASNCQMLCRECNRRKSSK